MTLIICFQFIFDYEGSTSVIFPLEDSNIPIVGCCANRLYAFIHVQQYFHYMA